MGTFILFLAVLCAGGGYVLANAGHGLSWADSLCWSARALCRNSELLTYMGLGLIGLWAVVKTASIMRP
jgi:hypothetical protein